MALGRKQTISFTCTEADARALRWLQGNQKLLDIWNIQKFDHNGLSHTIEIEYIMK